MGGGGGVSCKHVPRDCELPTYLIVVGLADKRFPLLLRSAPPPLTGLISQTYRKNISATAVFRRITLITQRKVNKNQFYRVLIITDTSSSKGSVILK